MLKKCFIRWSHRIQSIQQWAATALGLTQRSIRLLYGPKEGSENVNISVNGYNIGLDLPTDFVFYSWHRIVYLISNPCHLTSPNFTVAINGIGKIIEAYHSIGKGYPSYSFPYGIAIDDSSQQTATVPDG